LADFDRFGRADMLFAKDKAIGAPMISLHAVQDCNFFCSAVLRVYG
jgi:sulfotransferase